MDTVSIAALNRKGACPGGVAFARWGLADGDDKIPVTLATVKRLDGCMNHYLEWYLDYGAPEKVRARMSRKLLEAARALVFALLPEEAYPELHAVLGVRRRSEYPSQREEALWLLLRKHLGFTLRGSRFLLPRSPRLVMTESGNVYEILGQLGLTQGTRRRILLEAYLGRELTKEDEG